MITGARFVIAVPDLARAGAYYARVQAAGATLRKELRDEPWGMREFAVETGDGHRIMFGSPRAQHA